jgi:hypothetical protein
MTRLDLLPARIDFDDARDLHTSNGKATTAATD